MCTLLSMAQDRWERPSASAATLAGPVRRLLRRVAAQLLHAFVCWQVARLTRRMAQFQPDDRLLP